MERKIYKVTYKVNGRNMSRKFYCFMDAEDFFISRSRYIRNRCSDLEIKCYENGKEKEIPTYMWSI